MIRVLYITRAKLSLTRSHCQNILKTAEALNAIDGCSVTVFSSRSDDKTPKQIFEAKGINKSFNLDIAKHSRALVTTVIAQRYTYNVLYFRDPFLWYVAFIARFLLRKKIIFEVHGSHEWKYAIPFWRIARTNAHGVVYITQALQQFYGGKKLSIVARSNGLDIGQYHMNVGRAQLRAALGLPPDKFIVMYMGSFLWFPIETIVEITRFLPSNTILVVVGAKESEMEVIKNLSTKHNIANRMLCFPRVVPIKVPSYLIVADVLLSPPAKIAYPGSLSSKLFEYLAAGVPMVAHDSGANRELLHHEQNALLVTSSDASDFAQAIGRLKNDSFLRQSIVTQARKDAAQYTWKYRSQLIFSLMKEILT